LISWYVAQNHYHGDCVSVTSIGFSCSLPWSPNTYAYTFEISEAITVLAKAALGVAVAWMLAPYLSLVANQIVVIMSGWKCDMSLDQEVFSIWKSLSDLPTELLQYAAKTALLSFVVLFGPIHEEFLFRQWLQSWMRSWVENPDSLMNKGLRVVGNGVIFGAAHISPTQGWVNVPIFCITGMVGAAFALMKEATGDITAATAAHVTYNGLAMYSFLSTTA